MQSAAPLGYEQKRPNMEDPSVNSTGLSAIITRFTKPHYKYTNYRINAFYIHSYVSANWNIMQHTALVKYL
jgi:hypothetical protein